MDPINGIDPKCPTAERSYKAITAELEAEGLVEGQAWATEFVKRCNGFPVQHVQTSSLCRTYRPDKDEREEDPRSPIWGGATLGLLVGLLVGFFRQSYWQTVLYGVGIGAAFGVVTNLLGWTAYLLLWVDRVIRKQ